MAILFTILIFVKLPGTWLPKKKTERGGIRRRALLGILLVHSINATCSRNECRPLLDFIVQCAIECGQCGSIHGWCATQQEKQIPSCLVHAMTLNIYEGLTVSGGRWAYRKHKAIKGGSLAFSR